MTKILPKVWQFYIHTYINTYIQTYIHTHINTHTLTQIHSHTHSHMMFNFNSFSGVKIYLRSFIN